MICQPLSPISHLLLAPRDMSVLCQIQMILNSNKLSVFLFPAYHVTIDTLPFKYCLMNLLLAYTLQSNWTPMMIAASAGHIQIVNLLIGCGAQVNAVNCNGQSALHYAASRGRLEVCITDLGKLIFLASGIIPSHEEA